MKALLFAVFVIALCCPVYAQQKDTISAKTNFQEPEQKINLLKKQNPCVLRITFETNYGNITLYEPFGLIADLTPIHPDKSDSIFFCIPAAYTSKDTTIDGLYFCNGIRARSAFNNKLTGACYFKDESFNIIPSAEIDSALISFIQERKMNFFQQSLLVYHSGIYPCTLFKEKKNMRRALVKLNGNMFVAESVDPLRIVDFQQALLEIGVTDAIYLDMGTWSEGWYKNNNCQYIRIGEKFQNTHLQTNWLIFKVLQER